MAKVAMTSSRTSEAATSSWVESGLEAQATTVAPPALSVRRRLAVSVVMWRQAPTVTPSRGRSLAKRSRMEVRTGMLLSAQAMRCRPRSASAGSAMSKFIGWGSPRLDGRSRAGCHGGRPSPGGQPSLELDEDGHRPRVQALLGGQVERNEVAVEDQV